MQNYKSYLSLIPHVEEIFSSKKTDRPHDVSAPFFTKPKDLLCTITMMKLAVVAALAGSAAAFAPASTGECFEVLLACKMRFLLCVKLTLLTLYFVFYSVLLNK